MSDTINIVATVTSLLILVVVGYAAWHLVRLTYLAAKRLYAWLEER